jgi:Asp-tRNA(Asn)/Glu-tRNA(Gln) amidotransferase A subunit family amidase
VNRFGPSNFEGVSDGVRLLGRHLEDATCLKVAKAVEARAGGFPSPPTRG